MHQYHIQYQKIAGIPVLADFVVKDNRPPKQFVSDLKDQGWWLEADKQWIAPGCLQGVTVII